MRKPHQSHRRRKSSQPIFQSLEPRSLFSGSPLSSIPALHSLPNATVKIYLDFDGDTTSSWGSYKPGTTPAYNIDGDSSTFSSTELSNIKQIWARVAEKYSPFNIDVTTVNPGSFGDKQAMHVVIGGTGSWVGSTTGGITYISSFYNSSPNTNFVFSSNLNGGAPQATGEAVAHELGHAFGLAHHSTWSGSSLTNEYAPGNSSTAPIMGNSYYATRGLWEDAVTDASSSTYQDDLAVISSSNNGFGYRADDVGNWITSASKLSLSGTSASASGVIEKTSDWDYFSFTTSGGSVSFSGNRSVNGGMLDLQLQLVNSSGNVVASANTSSLDESLSATLAAGTYYIGVGSHGTYGDVGQYTLTGTVNSSKTTTTTTTTITAYSPSAPSTLSASSSSTSSISLAWADNSGIETGFKIERMTGSSGSWSQIATLGANSTSYTDSSLSSSTSYSYRIRATNSVGDSSYSNTASATTKSAVSVTTVSPVGTKVTGTTLGTSGSYNNAGNTYANAFDGSLSSYFDSSTASGAYLGYDLGSSKTITAIRFAPRSGMASRMLGGQFQGSSNGSSWTTFYTISSTPADGSYTTVNLTSTPSYRYVRYLSPANSYGNIAELEFYSSTVSSPVTTTANKLTGTLIATSGSWGNSGNTASKAIDGSLSSFFDAPTGDNDYVGYDLGSAKTITGIRFVPRSGYASRMLGGKFQASNDGSTWTTLYTISSTPSDGSWSSASVSNSSAFRYVRYLAPAGSYGDVAEVEFDGYASASTGAVKVSGSAIGTSGSWGNSGNTIAKVFDGSLSTYFDSASADNSWVGIDFGSAHYIASVRFAPRSGYASRMVGGKFQASNDGSNWTTLATISTTPTDGSYNVVNFAPGSYRYVRYLSPAGSNGNIAELEFYSGALALPLAAPSFSTLPITYAASAQSILGIF